MKRLLGLFSLGVLAVLVAAAGHAVSVTGPNVSNDASGPNLLSFDLDVTDGSPQLVDVSLDGDAGPLTFNAIVFNFSPEAFQSFTIELLGGAVFSVVGEASDGLGNFFPNASGGAATAAIGFAPDQILTLAGFEIGDPLGLTGALDWSIDVSGVSGGSFQIALRPTLVPEPTTGLLVCFGLAALARRRRTSAGRNSNSQHRKGDVLKLTYAMLAVAVGLSAPAAQAQFRNPANPVAAQFTFLNPGLVPQYITRNAGNNLDQIQFLPIGSSNPTHVIACIEVTLSCLSGSCADPFVFGDKLTPSVQRIELATGNVETVVRGMTICDGIRTTPWGTVVATEEDFVSDTGAAYEILDPMTSDEFTILDRRGGGQAAVIVDQTGADASDRIAKRTALPVIRYEGLYVDETGVVLAGDEERPGSYAPGDTDGGAVFKFIPSTLRNPASGNISALSQSPLVAGTNYALQVSCISNSQQFGQGCEIGGGQWRLLSPVPAATGEDLGVARIGRESADQIGATGYYRPEDLHDDPNYSDPLNPNAVRFCFANTGDRSASNFGEVQCAVDRDITTAPNNRSVTINRFVEGNSSLNQPDNLAFQPGSNVLYVIEDNPNGDVWACLADGVDTDNKTDGCLKVLTLADASAEPTGLIFTPDGSTAIFNIQHSADGLMPLFDDFSTDDLVKISGFGPVTLGADFGERTETLMKRSSKQLFGLNPVQ